jgi:cobyrinic acid a,c-diamide synthase
MSGPEDFIRQQTKLESLWGIPVLGGLPEAPSLRAAARRLAPGDEPPHDLIQSLGDLLAAHVRIDRIRQIAESRPAVSRNAVSRNQVDAGRPRLLRPRRCRDVRVAVAFDEAFHCYFPDTLDLLETIGADVVDFSPLHDESLPPSTDLVYLGCGHPERFAAELSSNHCMTMALRDHLHQGGRMYGEGGGLAYLCRYLELPSGELISMIGALPALARQNAVPQAPRPVTATLAHDSWLGRQGSPVRGYLNSAWIIEPVGQLSPLASEPPRQYDLIEHRGAIGSRIHVNFAAQWELLRHLSLVGSAPTDRLATGR